ncbi:secreted RxLR effector protein 161-like [Nicotiana tomentosiformis]|uniref:secreted RxLR effector protein 161-like n=1 Tax=Nicotiana tomentosiformis TaxID=4098 RepID=UPI00388C4CE0
MGEVDYILGVNIQRDCSKKLLSLSQETYIKKILERFRMNSCKFVDTPIARGETLSLEMCPKTENEKEDMSQVPYSSAVESLMYAMMCTRPDICYAIGLVSRYQSSPRRDHWKDVKRIFRYLKGTADYSLCYSENDLYLGGYIDVDWASDRNDRKSTSGYAFLLNGGAISWKNKKQTCTALSIMEAEFVACASAI